MESRKREFVISKIIIRGGEVVKGGLAVLMLMVLLSTAAAVASNVTLPGRGCRSKCGGVDIPYPFGIDPNCSLPGFALSCNDTGNGVYKPFHTNVEFINISLSSGQAHIYNHISWKCYNSTSKTVSWSRWRMSLIGTPYRFSETRNKFVTLGCESLAYIRVAENISNNYATGCVSVCHDDKSLSSGSCSGIGCCQTSIPKGMAYYEVSFDRNFNNSDVWQFNRCSYAVLVEERSFNFSTSYVTSDEFFRTTGGQVPLVLDWAIGNETCDAARRNPTAYACVSENSDCVDSPNGPGYFCNCLRGYQGNPYVHGGCQDIDECHADPSPCIASAICINTPGNFTCSCPPGTHGKASEGGTCYQNQKLALSVKLVTGISIGLVLVLSFSFCVYIVHGRRKLVKVKQTYFQQNGGWLLLEEIKLKQGLAFKIFTKEELDEATNKFDKNQILGGGGQGIVYKGILKDHRTVAVKKSKIINERQKKEFGKEMIILSQTNHINVVKLLGCCLEVEVPMLVYEFIPNGTLFQLIHENNHKFSISLDVRLKIASESAEALAYLHSSASPPILHGDVKTSNILLADNYTSKVSDFGASVLFPMDGNQFATLVQGTWGYLDPESIETHQLTDRSDVYSFGVVLLELLTGKKALYSEGSEKERSLASTFITTMKENRLLELLDSQIKNEDDIEVIEEVAELARQCLNARGDERPTMKEVAEELNRLRKFKQHPWVQHNIEEIESLLGEPSSYQKNNTSEYYSLDKKATLDIESGR